MRVRHLHAWDLTPREAVELQHRLRRKVETADRLGPLRRVAGVDVGFDRRRRVARAAVVVLSWPELRPLEDSIAEQQVSFPYIPGLLSFREVPVVVQALTGLTAPPDLFFCDGHGLAHPRRFGLACHLGLITDTPAIGVAKSRLVGSHRELGIERGATQPLLFDDEVVGMVLRTRAGVRPVYVSVGHRVALERAVALVLRVCPRYRLPETTRRAHRLAARRRPGSR